MGSRWTEQPGYARQAVPSLKSGIRVSLSLLQLLPEREEQPWKGPRASGQAGCPLVACVHVPRGRMPSGTQVHLKTIRLSPQTTRTCRCLRPGGHDSGGGEDGAEGRTRGPSLLWAQAAHSESAFGRGLCVGPCAPRSSAPHPPEPAATALAERLISNTYGYRRYWSLQVTLNNPPKGKS